MLYWSPTGSVLIDLLINLTIFLIVVGFIGAAAKDLFFTACKGIGWLLGTVIGWIITLPIKLVSSIVGHIRSRSAPSMEPEYYQPMPEPDSEVMTAEHSYTTPDNVQHHVVYVQSEQDRSIRSIREMSRQIMERREHQQAAAAPVKAKEMTL